MLRILLATVAISSAAFAQDAPPFATYHSASPATLNDPHDLAFGPDGRLYVADKFANRVTILDPDTLEIVGSIGEDRLFGVHDVSFGPDGLLYAAVTSLGAVAIYDVTTDPATSMGALSPFPRTEGALAHSNGRIYVMASGTGELVALDGDWIAAVAQGMVGAHDVAEAPDGTIWVADNRQQRLVQFDTDLTQLRVMNGPQYGFAGPRYMDITPDGLLIVADQDAHRILKIDPFEDRLLGVIGTGRPGEGPGMFDDPEGVAVRDNSYYFADSDNNRVVKYVVILN